MSIMTGADPDLLEELARELTASAERLRGLQANLGTRVQQCPWQGQDAERVRTEWVSRHDQAMARLATDLAGAAEVASRNAAEQRQASAADGPSGVAAGSGGPAVIGAGTGAGDVPGGVGIGTSAGGPPELSVSGEGSFTAGDLTAEGSFDAGIQDRFSADGPEFELAGPAFGQEITDEKGELVLAEAGVSADAQYSVADARAEGTADLGIAHAEGEATAMVGARAEGDAGVKLTEGGVVAAAGVSAMAGAAAEIKGSVGAGGHSVGAEAHATAGVEFKAEAEAEFSAHHVGVSLELAAALGVGGGAKIDVSIDPSAAAEQLGDLLDELDELDEL